MSARLTELRGGRRPHRKINPWAQSTAASIAESQTRIAPSSWWTAHAAPNARDEFMAAAKERHIRREHKRHALTLRVDAQ